MTLNPIQHAQKQNDVFTIQYNQLIFSYLLAYKNKIKLNVRETFIFLTQTFVLIF
ncbi:hypothetical protein SAMN05428975_3603 [Mucilaginibacter sp. OK268]|nr:hypothetical protein SAMN05428975_3603 [Mucilaginibacter sp. OK268]